MAEIRDIFDQLIRDEGCRLKPYRDSVGKLTIGIGRNLDDVGITAVEANDLLNNDVRRVAAQLQTALPWFTQLDECRRAVLLNMGFNMGVPGLLGFRQTLAAIERGDYQSAADQMLQSKWAMQVGARAQRLAIQMRTGEWQ